ncbi:hypothetical protein [Streptomyces sp. ISID311]|uniref:hypothetical protein n=1 Tax=Streptomyces sp. ISID311 TaxID=2601673 RepID=UPI0011BD3CD8|nr:hypothetical protein [Streptomyces sp. ISID311]TXC97476.1 hypothetical protein FS847_13310 [Streptomyces sp. ISID311]
MQQAAPGFYGERFHASTLSAPRRCAMGGGATRPVNHAARPLVPVHNDDRCVVAEVDQGRPSDHPAGGHVTAKEWAASSAGLCGVEVMAPHRGVGPRV